ncbi:MAG: hypothetical protein KKG00_05810 [Bacteroidetes bacterium]|nr:hypothetical protein [Bacteroidota bacterium]
MPAEDKKYQVPDPDLTQLLSDFKARIKHDWIDILDIRQHGDAFRGIENLPSKNAFYHDLADVLNARYKARFGPGLAALKEIGTYTIRRIFEEGDRRNYDDKTRDMLAVYLGYANWAAYRMRATGRETPDTSGAEKATPSTFTFSIPRYALVAALGLVLLLTGGYYAYSWWRDQPDGERLTLLSTSSPSAPSKLVVRYDLRGLDYQDAYISCGERQVIPQQRVGIITFEVTLPQYSPVELFVDGKRLAMVTQSIESDGWEGFLSLLVPLEKSSFYQEGLLRLPYHPSPANAQEEYYPAFLNFRDYGLSADAMLFEARVLNNAKVGGQWAYDVSVDLVGAYHRAFFNVLAPDAVIYARAGVAEVELKGSKHPELKALGYAMDDWCILAMRIEDKKAVIFINGKEVLSMAYREELGDLKGIQFYLKGSGAVDWVRVRDLKTGEVKYFDDFLGK